VSTKPEALPIVAWRLKNNWGDYHYLEGIGLPDAEPLAEHAQATAQLAALQAEADAAKAELDALKERTNYLLSLSQAKVEWFRVDAERYTILRRGQHWSVINGIGDELKGDALDAAIDAALLARKGE
jgi:hypothetical protein